MAIIGSGSLVVLVLTACSTFGSRPQPLPNLPQPLQLQVTQQLVPSGADVPDTSVAPVAPAFTYCNDACQAATALTPVSTVALVAPQTETAQDTAPSPWVAHTTVVASRSTPTEVSSQIQQFTVRFAYCSPLLQSYQKQLLTHWVLVQPDHDRADFRLSVHTDLSGPRSGQLARQRGDSVADALAQAGVTGAVERSQAFDAKQRLVVVSRQHATAAARAETPTSVSISSFPTAFSLPASAPLAGLTLESSLGSEIPHSFSFRLRSRS